MPTDENERRVHTVSIVVPVYQGASTLTDLIGELRSMVDIGETAGGARFRVAEVLLVHDRGPDHSDEVIRELGEANDFVRPVWLSRNFGQHAATLAGMASSGSDWIVTMDEDGQHDPAFIPKMLDRALDERATVVYAAPTNAPSHGWFRNGTSRVAKWTFVNLLSSETQPGYHSYRLVLGEIGRSLAAYSGSGIYLDVALGWITQRFATCPVELRHEGERASGYSTRRLLSHFWRLVLTSGTRPMRIMSLVGALFSLLGFCTAALILLGRITGRIEVEGWASLTIVMLVGIGLVLFTLGVAAEYVGVAARMAMGQPPYLIVADDADGPLADSQR